MCNHDKKQLPKGSALEHGAAHEQHHRSWSRRSFIRNLGLTAGASMFLGKVPLNAVVNAPLGMALNGADTGRILVLIRLKGGNDGLNMIVPVFDYDTYRSKRPTIAIAEQELLRLDDEFAMPKTMEPLNARWQEGQMRVVNSVGYPEQNLSHFRSSDIWASASDAEVVDNTGWLGRHLGQEYPDFLANPPAHPPAIQIGGFGNLAFNNAQMVNMGVVVNNPGELSRIAQDGRLYDPNDVPSGYYGEQLSFLRSVANSTFKYAGVINESYEQGSNTVEYDNYGLGEQLALVARLIKGGLDTRFYMVTLDGFDTHAQQGQSHPYLMGVLSKAVNDFFTDLQSSGDADRVLAMTVSEFGRRIEQNASGGTDHGAAAPLLLFGNGLSGSSVEGKKPDLQDVDPVGNLKFGTDFRSVYSTVLENWLCLSPAAVDQVMGQSFARMPELGLSCNSVVATDDPYTAGQGLDYELSYLPGEVRVRYFVPTYGTVKIQVFDMLGRPVEVLQQGRQQRGWHECQFRGVNAQLISGQYVLHLQVGRQRASAKFLSVR